MNLREKCPYCGSELVTFCDCCELPWCPSCGRHLSPKEKKSSAKEHSVELRSKTKKYMLYSCDKNGHNILIEENLEKNEAEEEIRCPIHKNLAGFEDFVAMVSIEDAEADHHIQRRFYEDRIDNIRKAVDSINEAHKEDHAKVKELEQDLIICRDLLANHDDLLDRTVKAEEKLKQKDKEIAIAVELVKNGKDEIIARQMSKVLDLQEKLKRISALIEDVKRRKPLFWDEASKLWFNEWLEKLRKEIVCHEE